MPGELSWNDCSGDYLSTVSCLMKCQHLVIRNCVIDRLMGHYYQYLKCVIKSQIWTYKPQRKGHILFASIQKRAARLANCFHTHKNRRAHTFLMRIEILQSLCCHLCLYGCQQLPGEVWSFVFYPVSGLDGTRLSSSQPPNHFFRFVPF